MLSIVNAFVHLLVHLNYRIVEIFRGWKLSRISRFRSNARKFLTEKILIECGGVINNGRAIILDNGSRNGYSPVPTMKCRILARKLGFLKRVMDRDADCLSGSVVLALSSDRVGIELREGEAYIARCSLLHSFCWLWILFSGSFRLLAWVLLSTTSTLVVSSMQMTLGHWLLVKHHCISLRISLPTAVGIPLHWLQIIVAVVMVTHTYLILVHFPLNINAVLLVVNMSKMAKCECYDTESILRCKNLLCKQITTMHVCTNACYMYKYVLLTCAVWVCSIGGFEDISGMYKKCIASFHNEVMNCWFFGHCRSVKPQQAKYCLYCMNIKQTWKWSFNACL